MVKHKTKEWADAIVDLIEENKLHIDNYRLDALLIVKSFRYSKDLVNLLRSPSIVRVEKNKIIDKVFASMNKIYINTIKLMNQKFLTNHIDDAFYKVYVNLSNTLGIATGELETSKKLNDDQIKKIEDHYSKKMNKKVELYQVISTYLLHGIKVTIEGEVHDGSLHGHIKHLKHELIR